MAIVNFTTSMLGLDKLILTDTTDYQGETVSNRYWIITKSNADIIEEAHPIIEGLTKEIEIDKDYAFVVKLALNYNTATGASSANKTKNVLVAPNLANDLYDLRKKFLDENGDCDCGEMDEKLLNDIELIDGFSEAAVNLISTDIVAAQKALDKANDLSNKYKCNI